MSDKFLSPSVSVIIPTFNECEWLPGTLKAVDDSLVLAGWTNAEIVVVNDGSTDQTLDIISTIATSTPLRAVNQDNQGRFYARLNGLNSCSSELILLLDSRVHTGLSSMKFLRRQLRDFPERTCWNGDVIIHTSGNPYAAFWSCTVKLAWRRYFKTRQLTSFSAQDYDFYPKGTGFFVAPRVDLIEACSKFDSLYADKSLASDDTHLIRPLAENGTIFIGPEFVCTYYSRDSLVKFVRHTYFRGTTFIDGYMRRKSRFLVPLLLLLPTLAFLFLLLVLQPLWTLSVMFAGVIAICFILRGNNCSWSEILGFLRVVPLFSPVYFLGIVRGAYLALVGRRDR